MSFDPDSPIQRRWRDLAADAPREEFFAALRDAIRESYLAEPGNPYRGSGRSRGADRWIETRHLLVDGIEADGDYLDVGCANGLLLDSLITWAAARGHTLTPHGIDFVPELVDLTQARFPDHADHFAVANVVDWQPTRTYDWVRTNLEYVPAPERAVMLVRLLERAVAPGGRLVVCHYRNQDEARVDIASLVEGLGLGVERVGHAPGVAVAWVRKGQALRTASMTRSRRGSKNA